MDYGRAIRIARARDGVSQKELARRCGVSPSYVSMLERGLRTSPSSVLVDSVCRELRVPPSVLAAMASSARERALAGPEAAEAIACAFLSWVTS